MKIALIFFVYGENKQEITFSQENKFNLKNTHNFFDRKMQFYRWRND